MQLTTDEAHDVMKLVDRRMAELNEALARDDRREGESELRSALDRLSLLRARLVEAGVGSGPSTHALP